MYQGNVRDFDVRFAAVEDTVKTWATSFGEKFRHRKFDVSAVRNVMESDGVPLCSTRSVYGSHMRTVWAYQC